MKYLSILFLVPPLLFSQEIVSIKQGEPAPFDGFVITKQFEKDRRQEHEELALQKNKNLLLSDLAATQEELVKFHKEQTIMAISEANKSQFKSYLYFVGGVLITGLISYGTVRSLR